MKITNMADFGDYIRGFWDDNPPPTSLGEEFLRRWKINRGLEEFDRESQSQLALGGSYPALIELGKPYLIIRKSGRDVFFYCFLEDLGDGVSFRELYCGLGQSLSNWIAYNKLIKKDNVEEWKISDLRTMGVLVGTPSYLQVFRDYDVYEFTTQNLNIFLNWSKSPWVGK